MDKLYLREMPHVVEDKYNKVIEKTLATQFFQDRTVFLNGEITADYANQVVSQLIYLAKTSEAEINIFINSNGGEVNAGLYIYDVLQSIKSPVNIYCTGRAASMAAVLLAGGQKGRRYILPHSEVMIHEPLLAGGVGGSTTSIKTLSESMLKTRKILNGILAKHTGRSLKEVNKATSFDNYMVAAEAVKFGICDAVIDSLL